jgi:sorbitol-specific phosphotransferase system component IIC
LAINVFSDFSNVFTGLTTGIIVIALVVITAINEIAHVIESKGAQRLSKFIVVPELVLLMVFAAMFVLRILNMLA